jgi:hypothetical protein
VIEANTPARRLKSKPIYESEPLAQGNVFDAIGGGGTADMLADPGNIGTGPADAVTMFATPAARKVATEKFLQSAKNLNIPNMEAAADTFASKYPRVAAHMNISPEVGNPHATAELSIPMIGVQPEKPLAVQLSDYGRNAADTSLEAAIDMMFHEGTHAAQALGNNRMGPLYGNASHLTGYTNNPFEVNARRAGDLATGKEVGPYRNVIDQLKDVVNPPKGPIDRFREWLSGPILEPPSNQQAKATIGSILERRESGQLWPLSPAAKNQAMNVEMRPKLPRQSHPGLELNSNPSARRMEELVDKFGGTGADPLPMDEASRMARASEQGYTHDVYHGTNKDFTEFADPIREGGYGTGDFGIHVSGDTTGANVRSGSLNTGSHGKIFDFESDFKHIVQPQEVGGRVMPLKAQMNKTLELPDMSIWKNPANYIRKFEDFQEGFDRDQVNDPAFFAKLADEAKRLRANQGYDNHQAMTQWQHKMREMMQEAGYDSIKYANNVESDGAPSYLLMDPRQLRSKFAKFDPKRANSRDLLASLAAAIGIGGVASHDPEE